MIDESIRIKLNQFMLAYERKCTEIQFEKQTIKQNVMLSIIQNKNNKKSPPSTINNPLQKSMMKLNQNLASSKETKFSEQKQIPDYKFSDIDSNDNNLQQMRKSNLNANSNSRLLQKSKVSVKDNNIYLLKNNFVNQQKESRQESNQKSIQNATKNDLYNESYLKSQKNKMKVQEFDQNQDKNLSLSQQKSYLKNTSNHKINNFILNQNDQMVESQLKNNKLNMNESSLSRNNRSRINQKNCENQFQKGQYAQNDEQSTSFIKKSQVGSKVFPNSQKVLKPNNPSIMRDYENQVQDLQNYPTFKKPSFQFITNLSQLRQSNPQNQDQEEENYQKEQQENQGQNLPAQSNFREYEEQQKSQIPHKKWNSNRRKEQWHQQEKEDYDENQYDQNESFANNNRSNTISNMEQDESMIMQSQLKQKPKLSVQPSRKSYMAFQINMEKSNLPNNQNLQELKKKKILELQRKRLQRMENNSKRKLNPSQLNTPNQKSQKILQKQQEQPYSNIFIGSNRQNLRKQADNRDSLNKSVNDRKQDRSRNIKNSGFRQEQVSNKQSMFQDNRTILTKYGQQSKISNRNRAVSPLNTVKTIHTTDKRPPLNRNKRQENIFAGQSGIQRNQADSGYQRQRSIHKVSDPKIVPVDRKNSFQKKSNIKIMVNAITYTCLPGELNRRQRQKLIDILDDYQNEFFIFLFKEYSRKVIKGIYILEGTQDRIVKIYGQKAPSEIYPEQIHQFYRFDSGSREFKKIDGCKSFSFSVHAVDLK